ncbi:MAG: hypothetical protein MUF00_02025 [Gemmatimonadaceae bacterium]|jgi:hypothetical protein|nr:hypothetical protein [Gemmatimonadaceae bacterium]
MAERKPFLLRVDRAVLEAMQRWANDDLRSLNGQIEFVLRRALAGVGRPVSVRGADAVDDAPEVSRDDAGESGGSSDIG